MSIQPLSIPEAAALDFAGADVRHFAPNDGVSVPALAGPTRQLAHRDNLIATKVNEVVAAVNNKEQFINLPTLRTTIPPTRSEVVTNFRIPPGMEARVFNAIVSSTPINSAEIEILYNEGASSSQFGNTTGTSVVKTKNEFTNGQEFKPSGEFVVKITNTGTVSADIVASVILTMRPIGQLPGTPLIAAVIQGKPGKRGPVGPPGERGPAGPPGASVAGSAGMLWRGTWDSGAVYGLKDGVHNGADGSSYISTVSNPDVGIAPHLNLDDWDLMAKAGEDGDIGDSLSWGGEYTPSTNYAQGAIVTRTNYATGVTRTYWAATSSVTNAPQVDINASMPAPWVELFGPSALPGYGQATRNCSVEIVSGATSAHAKGTIIAYTDGASTVQLQGDGSIPMDENKSYGRVGAVAGTGYILKVYRPAMSAIYREIISNEDFTGANNPTFTISDALPSTLAGYTWEILEPRMGAEDGEEPATGLQGYAELPTTSPFDMPITETWIEGPAAAGARGWAFLYGVYRVSLKGQIRITLPDIATGSAKIDWKNSFVFINVANNSQVRSVSAGINVLLPQVYVDPDGADRVYVVNNPNDRPSHVSMFILGSGVIQS